MGLGAKKGAEITVTVDGEDEEIAAAELETFLKENLQEAFLFGKHREMDY